MDDVSCSIGEEEGWVSCSFSQTHNCGHKEDIFLTCSFPSDEPDTEESVTAVIAPEIRSTLFRLVDDDKNEVEGGQMGLLLYNGGTVCDDSLSFTDNSADAICREMGYTAASDWDTGDKYKSQSGYDIKLVDVSCSSGNWSSCTYSLKPYLRRYNCAHEQDVFLECEAAADAVDIDKCFVRNGRTSETGVIIEAKPYTGRKRCVELCLSRDK